MKRSILIFLVLGLSIILFGCSKDEFLAPGVDQGDQGTIFLKSAKTGIFTGVCTPVDPDNGVWYDLADDWRVTGTSLWTFESDEGATEVWGTSELFVDIGKPNGVPKGKPEGLSRGKWDVTWDGIVTPILDEDEAQIGVNIVCNAYGTGTKGAVKGLVAEWTYTMNWRFADDPSTFFYETEGFIEKNKKKNKD